MQIVTQMGRGRPPKIETAGPQFFVTQARKRVKMPRTLRFYYKIYTNVTVPNKVAEVLEKNAELWYIRYGDLYYTGTSGDEQCIEGVKQHEECVDWKRGHKEPEWCDCDEESDEEDEEAESVLEEETAESMKERGAMDGDGFVICPDCNKGGCDGNCEDESICEVCAKDAKGGETLAADGEEVKACKTCAEGARS